MHLHHRNHNRFYEFSTENCKKNEFYIEEGKDKVYFYIDSKGGWYDEFGYYYDKNGDRKGKRRSEDSEGQASEAQRYRERKESNDGKSFTVSSSRFRFVYDDKGGFYDEFGNYYNHEGQS